jgi:hypothetical protein
MFGRHSFNVTEVITFWSSWEQMNKYFGVTVFETVEKV